MAAQANGKLTSRSPMVTHLLASYATDVFYQGVKIGRKPREKMLTTATPTPRYVQSKWLPIAGLAGRMKTLCLVKNDSTCYQSGMAQFLVRDVPEDVAAALKKRAMKNGRSTEAEHRAILLEALKPKSGDFWEEAAKLREALKGRKFTDSAKLIRQDRDSR